MHTCNCIVVVPVFKVVSWVFLYGYKVVSYWSKPYLNFKSIGGCGI